MDHWQQQRIDHFDFGSIYPAIPLLMPLLFGLLLGLLNFLIVHLQFYTEVDSIPSIRIATSNAINKAHTTKIVTAFAFAVLNKT